MMFYILELIKVIILGIVEGITEWLPISSTGHMILVDEFLKLGQSDAFKEMFLVVIQLGAILAVVVMYFNKLNPFSAKKSKEQQRQTFDMWIKVLIGVVPAGVLGVLFDDFLESKFYNFPTVAFTLVLYGILFLVVENNKNLKKQNIKKFTELTYQTAFFIGLFQVLSLIPGTSRSGATIIGALILGLSRSLAAEFSFFMSIPVMFGASALKLLKFGFSYTFFQIFILFVGMFVAFVVSVLAIKFLMKYIKKNDFKIFGWYRIVLGAVLIVYYLILK
ncbi:MAG: undecaprenyl-diphosphate phosphatase [Peptoniphilaceae bacterium]|uniref:undecaprenyl-diphosphate phosphatase n=1 Tax=Parvimonas sp. TaxID=1944660 RepID=UPI0025F7AE4D|nr:undecaprenyl-diphosphate phosphatase [Parvimonas sp.]MCI5997121.1 undecaprenyl-diphosphate phosphatase [Parvimonas sp.]MDD7764897.1 undecaprenyl-diphosphate phosphatase [Peptoniphilaceae bacterium]MDY3050095.1 undecaprenyl-diphosphate phosphatase [Parvimonas sp.]